jgi:hypothetical protein
MATARLPRVSLEIRWPLELFLNAMPGMTGNRTLEDKYLNGLVAAVEMIRKGCTACHRIGGPSQSIIAGAEPHPAANLRRNHNMPGCRARSLSAIEVSIHPSRRVSSIDDISGTSVIGYRLSPWIDS